MQGMPASTAAVAVVLGFAAAVQMASGFGFALVSVPLLAIVVGPHDAVLLALLVGTVFNGWQAVEGRGVADRGVVARVLVGAGLGLPVGYLVYRALGKDSLTVVVGVLVLVAAVLLWRGWSMPVVGRGTDLVVGVCTGVLTTSTGTNGPPIVTVLHARGLDSDAFRATATTVFLVLDLLAVCLFTGVGELGAAEAVTAAIALPVVVAGGYAGYRARRLLTPAGFRRVVLLLLAATGAAAVLAGLT